jgi:hypothetical protein
MAGGLASALGVGNGRRLREYTARGIFYVACGANYSIAPHEHLVERGHRILKGGTGIYDGRVRKSKRGDAYSGKGVQMVSAFGWARRVPGYPFLAPAFKRTQGLMDTTFMDELKRQTQMELTKMADTAFASALRGK